ncbi:MAG: DUF92 domain-containing protein [Anaerolineae bacterium]|nr:DUF92 domain-containing protein [Anaerolineae bacterium]
MAQYQQILIGLILAILVATLAWRAGALSKSGAWAAVLTGGLIFGLGGFAWAVLLLTFFISSSALSRAFGKRKASLAEKFSKGSRRDWGQVLANGGLGACLVIAYTILPQPEWIWLAYAGAMAAVNADTWSTELGVLSKVPPRMITTGKQVERGTSGGITQLGTVAALGGAALVGIVAILFSLDTTWFRYLVIIILGGLAGALFDSILGATVQAIYWCPTCEKETERHPSHSCGSKTTQLRGWHWFNNDVVNLACSLMGALVAAGLWFLLR